jgi:mannosyltransferase OCH1-like enzyme
MQIAVLVFGQFRSVKDHLENNLVQIQKAFSGLTPTFHVYILTDKLDSGNYSEETEAFVKQTFQHYNFSIKFLEFWEDFSDCHAIEGILNRYLKDKIHNFYIKNKIKEPPCHRAEWAASMWYRRYILWKFYEAFATNNQLTYDQVLFTRIFDTRITTLKPIKPLLHSNPDALHFCIDTLFLGSHATMKFLFHFGSSTNFWRDFEWTPELTQEIAKFDLGLSKVKQTFSSEAQIYQYIRFHILHHKNIRYDFSNPDTNQSDAYLRVKIERINVIPKRILQIALGAEYRSKIDLPKVKHFLINPANTDHEYTLFTDEDCEKFLATHFPEFQVTYKEIKRPQYKSDLVRYLYLYTFGGYYIDIDIKLMLPLYSIFERTNNSSTFFAIGAHTSKRNNTYEVCNGFIGTIPGRQEFLDLAVRISEDPNPEDYGTNVKTLYKVLAKVQEIKPFEKNLKTSIYFFREVSHFKRYFFVNHKEVIGLSNGNTTTT